MMRFPTRIQVRVFRAAQRIALIALVCALGSSQVLGNVVKYVQKPDPSFSWQVKDKRTLPEGSLLIDVALTSQRWMDITWRHTVRIIVPSGRSSSPLCGLFITGGDPSEEETVYIGSAARLLGWPIAILFNIPNQPLYGGLTEDALIAYTFSKAVETRNEEWPLLFPMAKSAVRAMDAVQACMSKELNAEITGFMTMGASKRGWTTWFTAVVDPRVKGIVPIVYNNLNLPRQMALQRLSFGEYSEQIGDYTKLGLPDMIHSDTGRALGRLVDPFSYRERITAPALMIVGTNDRYWPLDAMNLYYEGLPGRRYILYCPNQGHGIADIPRVLAGITGFGKMLEGAMPFPDLKWTCSETETLVKIEASSNPPVQSMSAWMAVSPTRDFREAKWTSSPMASQGEGFSIERRKPAQGFGAILGDFEFRQVGQAFHLCTSVYIIGPDPKTGRSKLLSWPIPKDKLNLAQPGD